MELLCSLILCLRGRVDGTDISAGQFILGGVLGVITPLPASASVCRCKLLLYISHICHPFRQSQSVI